MAEAIYIVSAIEWIGKLVTCWITSQMLRIFFDRVGQDIYPR